MSPRKGVDLNSLRPQDKVALRKRWNFMGSKNQDLIRTPSTAGLRVRFQHIVSQDPVPLLRFPKVHHHYSNRLWPTTSGDHFCWGAAVLRPRLAFRISELMSTWYVKQWAQTL